MGRGPEAPDPFRPAPGPRTVAPLPPEAEPFVGAYRPVYDQDDQALAKERGIDLKAAEVTLEILQEGRFRLQSPSGWVSGPVTFEDSRLVLEPQRAEFQPLAATVEPLVASLDGRRLTLRPVGQAKRLVFQRAD